jgi:tetratricopeptide (TPR) repeat protein
MLGKMGMIAGAIVLFALTGPASAARHHPRAHASCANTAKVTLDQQISGCTTLIKASKKRKNEKIGRIFNDRGVAYYRKGQYADAIADFDQAIEFGYVRALFYRILAKEKQGDEAGAVADIAAFKHTR